MQEEERATGCLQNETRKVEEKKQFFFADPDVDTHPWLLSH
jgi:hypothetical protein